MADTQSPADSVEATQEDDEINLLDLLIVLAKHKKTILRITLGSAIAAVGISLLIPNTYTATTKILTPQQSQSNAAAILGQLGGLGGMAGSALGLKNPNDAYIAMMKSRTLLDSMVQRFDLQKIYETKFLTDARNRLASATVITAGKDGVITVEFEDKDPKHAAAVANAYVEELDKFTLNLAVTEASQRRLFFEKQLNETKENLSKAELDLKVFQEKAGLISPGGQAGLAVTASANLHAQITAKEVQLSSMRSFATEQNPDIQRVQNELAGLRAQMAKLDSDASFGKGDVVVSIGKGPEVGLEYARKMREVKYHQVLFELFVRQYESAKIDEAKNATLIQVLDKAVEPEKKSKPKRSLIVLLTALGALFLSVIWVFIKEANEKARRNPVQAERLRTLGSYLRWR